MKNLHESILWMFCSFFCLFNSFPLQAHRDKDIENLRKDVITKTLELDVDEEGIESILTSVRVDGTWPGIDYTDVRREAFQHTIHLNNLVKLAVAYNKEGCKWKGKRKVRETFSKGVAYWIKHDFKCDNWWNNEIGTPSNFISMLLAMDDHLTGKQVEGMMHIAKRAGLTAWGARPSGDRIALAGLEAKWALFDRDVERVEKMMKEIEREMKIVHEGKPGIQADYCFHHRSDGVNNTLTYGLQFINVFAEWAYYVSDTRFRFSDKAMRLAVDYYLDGICKQMVYGQTEDTGILNRDITRKHGKLMSAVTPVYLMRATDYRKDELQNIVNARTGKNFTVPSYAKFFWQTEHFVYQRPHYYTSVRMFSVRNCNMEEPYNNEGIKNHFRADGTNYLTLQGDEYLNMAPIFDWTCIPGTTTPVLDKMPDMWQIQKEGQTDFVGAVTDGTYGAVGFDFVSPHFPLKAKKSWFFFDEEYVCLGAGIRASCKYPIVTTLNQCYLNGEVKVISQAQVNQVKKGTHVYKRAEAVWHNGVGYLFPQAENITISNKEETGTWYDVSPRSNSSKELQRADVFKLRIEHGVRPRNDAYAYIVIPGVDFEQLQRCKQSSKVRILSNTTELQAVEHTEKGLVYLNAYQSALLKFSGERGYVEIDSPGMVMLKYAKNNKLSSVVVSDPTRKQKRIHLILSGRHSSVDGNEYIRTSYSAEKDETYVSILLPQADEAGKSISVSLSCE